MTTAIVVAYMMAVAAFQAEAKRRFVYYSHAGGPDAEHTTLPGQRSEWCEILMWESHSTAML